MRCNLQDRESEVSKRSRQGRHLLFGRADRLVETDQRVIPIAGQTRRWRRRISTLANFRGHRSLWALGVRPRSDADGPPAPGANFGLALLADSLIRFAIVSRSRT